MGERSYSIESYEGELHHLRFGEEDDDWGCLCTFPHNDRVEGGLSLDRVRSLALLGAAVVLAIWEADGFDHHGVRSVPTYGTYVRLPDAVPEWICEGIKRALPGGA